MRKILFHADTEGLFYFLVLCSWICQSKDFNRDVWSLYFKKGVSKMTSLWALLYLLNGLGNLIHNLHFQCLRHTEVFKYYESNRGKKYALSMNMQEHTTIFSKSTSELQIIMHQAHIDTSCREAIHFRHMWNGYADIALRDALIQHWKGPHLESTQNVHSLWLHYWKDHQNIISSNNWRHCRSIFVITAPIKLAKDHKHINTQWQTNFPFTQWHWLVYCQIL